ncbi:MAG: sugar ABC transporter permease [Chloroflexia bacterium]
MQGAAELRPQRPIPGTEGTAAPGRFLIALLALIAVVAALWLGFLFLRDNDAPQLVSALVAILWGVGGIAALFTTANMLVESLSNKWRSRVQPYIFVGPAVAILAWFLLIPTIRTLFQSFFLGSSNNFAGLENYIKAFTSRDMLQAFQNNLLWLVAGTAGCVVLGLLIAVLADRSRFETLAKALIFMPMAISFVGAGVIWKFMYARQPEGEPQIGVLNAIVTGLGGQPQAWIQSPPWNNFFLILVLIWMQTGFALVIFSAALKGVPEEMLEAARLDGASEIQAFFRIIIPFIQGTIITVTTTIAIFTLKIFDVVIVMTGGQFNTDVVATQFYKNYFNNPGYGSAIAIVLFVAVLPVMIYNLREFRKQEGF